MVLLLDTNICIYLIREKPRSILDRFNEHAAGDIGISVITLVGLALRIRYRTALAVSDSAD